MAAELRQLIQKQPAMVCPRHLTRPRHLATPDQPHSRNGVVGARHSLVVMKSVRPLVRPATRR
jgi:hypothetical protein